MNSDLYYEVHVTIEPVFGKDLDIVENIATCHGFKVADLLMLRNREATEERSNKDTFMTTRGKSFDDCVKRTCNLIGELQDNGVKVWRYKLEDTLFDSKIEDILGLIGES